MQIAINLPNDFVSFQSAADIEKAELLEELAGMRPAQMPEDFMTHRQDEWL